MLLEFETESSHLDRGQYHLVEGNFLPKIALIEVSSFYHFLSIIIMHSDARKTSLTTITLRQFNLQNFVVLGQVELYISCHLILNRN